MTITHTVATPATPDRVWSAWTDVASWPEWDTELRTARLDGAFSVNATGTLEPRIGTPSRFVISEIDPGRSYAFVTSLPLGSLIVRRWITPEEDRTLFTHEVSFARAAGLTVPLYHDPSGSLATALGEWVAHRYLVIDGKGTIRARTDSLIEAVRLLEIFELESRATA